jgi:hypothetical protein
MIYLAGGVDSAGTAQDPLEADGTSSTASWKKTQNGSQYSVIAAYGTWGSGTIKVQHEVTPSNWIEIASLTTGATTSWAMKILPNGNYRAVLSGSTDPELTVVLKPV